MLENLSKYKVVLASNSPRRKELLAGLGLEFQVRTIPGIDESYPREPVHVHIGKSLADDGAKVWILEDGSCKEEYNKNISDSELKKIMKTISAYHEDVVKQWEDFFEVKAEYKQIKIKTPKKEKEKNIVKSNKSPYKANRVKVVRRTSKRRGSPSNGNGGDCKVIRR